MLEQQYLQLLRKLYNKATSNSDKPILNDNRTGVKTIALANQTLRHDLSNQELPLLYSKKVLVSAIIHELVWMLSGSTNIKYLNDNKVNIWNNWKLPYTLDRELIKIKPNKKQEWIPYNGNYSSRGSNGNKRSITDKLSSIWKKMLKRCYDSTSHNYKFYGGCGIFVCERWHDVANFIEDAQKLPHWQYKLDNWNEFDLDKDYYGGNCYSPENCVWLRSDENTFYTKSCSPIEVKEPNGNITEYISSKYVSKKFGIPIATLCRLVNNQNKTKILKGNTIKFKNWEFNKIKNKDELIRLKLIPFGELGKVYGYQMRNWNTLKFVNKMTLENSLDSINNSYEKYDIIDNSSYADKVLVRHTVDQIKKIEWQLKNNPNDRRIVLNLWNVTDLDEMSLQACHMNTVFTVIDGKLNSHLTMRSADLFLGVPFNVVFYSILTIILAKLNGLELGEFCVTMVNCHIYENQLEAIKTQLDRIRVNDLNLNDPEWDIHLFLDGVELPTLEFEVKDSVLDYKFEDLKVNNYKHLSFIKAPVAV